MKLRAYQTTTIANVDAAFAAGHRRVLVVGPTGAGKGTVAANLMVRAALAGQRVLYIAHLQELLTGVGGMQDRLAEIPRWQGVIDIMTVQSMLGKTLGKYDLVVVDEAHHYRADEWQQVIRALGKRVRVIGFTATPQRSDGKAMGDVFDHLIEMVSYSALLKKGWIVGCRVLHPPTPLDGDLAMDPLDAYLSYAKGSSALVYVSTIADAEDGAKRTRAAGISSEAIHRWTDAAARGAAFSGLHAGTVKVVWNVYTMTEGIDVPRVSTVVLARQCTHPITYLQVVGRMLRPRPGKKRSLLLDLTGASYRHGEPTEDRAYSLEGKRPIGFAGGDVQVHQAAPQRRTPAVLNVGLVEYDRARVFARGGKRVVDWSKYALGKESDKAIARQAGVSSALVKSARRKRGIPAFGSAQRRIIAGIDWKAAGLGRYSDRAVARRLGVSVHTVYVARTKRGIAPWRVREVRVDWDHVGLGKEADRHIAKRLGCSATVVQKQREARGIPVFKALDWDRQPLGKLPDADLARRLGVTVKVVRWARGKRRIPAAPREESAYLTADAVRAIIREYARGGVSQASVGRKHGISETAVGRIIRGKSWLGLDGGAEHA